MKKNIKLLLFISILIFIISVPVQAGTGKNKLTLNKSQVSMYVTESTSIKATVKGKSKKIVWKSSNTKVATVKNGTVVAKRPGTVTITASASGIKKSCKIRVRGDWYQKVLKSPDKAYAVRRDVDNKIYKIYKRDFADCGLVDINHDGVKELILCNYPQIAFFTYYKGKVTPLIYSSYTRGCYFKGNYITIKHGTSSENICRTYVLKNGKFKEVINYFHTTSTAYRVPIYQIRNKNCSKNTFFRTYNKYMENAQDIFEVFR